MNLTVPIVTDDIGTVVSRMRPINDADDYGQGMINYLDSINASASNRLLMPFYMHGHRKEINKRLLDKTKDSVFKNQKYPLIALRQDIPEQVEKGIWHYSLNILIANYNDRKWNSEERKENIFKPVLYPLYERFLAELGRSGLFFWPANGNLDYPEHTKVDRPFFGTEDQEGNVKNIFDDPIDAIEIIGLKVNQRSKNLNC